MISVTVTPSSANVRAAASKPFTAAVQNSPNQSVTWSVNGIPGGNSSTGTISATGVYSAPATLPNINTVAIQAAAAAQSSATASSSVTLWNPTPGISSVTPVTFSAGTFSLSVSGSSFLPGSQILFNGVALTTTFVSSAQLTATGAQSAAGTYPVSVLNPNPGSSNSTSINISVTAVSSGGGGNPPPPPNACNVISTGQGAALNGFLPFPPDNLWNKNISTASVDTNSAAILSFIGPADAIHPDFGSGQYQGSTIGIPYVVVGSTQPLVPVNFTAYGDESDPGPMPTPPSAPIEGYPNPGNGDRHVLLLDNSNCWLYELDNSFLNSDNSWNADSAAVFDLLADPQRPLTWTSADAAGLSIFAGLVRYDEVAAGHINHALRVTLQHSRAAFTPPASHWAANSSNPDAAPMGMRLRLKSTFNISTFSPANQVILKAMQQFGLIMADNGSNMYISGAPDERWDNNDLHNLDQVTASDFEILTLNPVYTQSNLPTGSSPIISTFTSSNSSVASGTPVTLTWSVSGASYLIVSPQIGATRGTSVVVTPTQTTTYTLNATNQFGRTTSTLTVTVH